MDIADRYGSALRRRLRSADAFSDLAILLGSFDLKMSRSRSRASLCSVTSADHLRSWWRSVLMCVFPLRSYPTEHAQSWFHLGFRQRGWRPAPTALRHREQSEAIQTRGRQWRLTLDRFAVARNDSRARVGLALDEVTPSTGRRMAAMRGKQPCAAKGATIFAPIFCTS